MHSSNLMGCGFLMLLLFLILLFLISSAAGLGCLLLSAHELSILLHAAMLMPLHVPWWPPAQFAALIAAEDCWEGAAWGAGAGGGGGCGVGGGGGGVEGELDTSGDRV